MAVIKESRQFKIGPVGVARASDLRESSRALSEALSTVGRIQYERAARSALKAGEEAGESAIIIDPETGLPQPLIPPKGFGSIASDAYDRVARNRFEFSIQNEIELKGKELAAKYANNPNGSALYHQTMSDYVESMTEAAEGAGYKSYIADTGTAYRDLTTQKLAVQQQERERAEMINFAKTAFTKGTNSVEALYASNPKEAAVIAQQSLQGIKDAVASNLLPKSFIKAAETDLMISEARGMIRGLSQNVDPEDLARIEFAFDTANPSLVPEGYKQFADMIESFGTDLASIELVANFATEHLRPIAILSAERIREQEKVITERQRENVFSLAGGMDAAGRDVERSIRDSFNSDSEIDTSVAVNLSIKNANRLDFQSEQAFFDSKNNPANASLAQQLATTALTIRSASAKSILLGNNKSSGKFDPQSITGIIQFLDTGDRSSIKDLSASSSLTVEMLSKVIKSDKTGTVRKESISLLTTIMDAGDKEEAISLELGSGEVSLIKNKIRSLPFGEGLAAVNDLIIKINESGETINSARKNNLNDIADAEVAALLEETVAITEATIDRSLKGLTTAQATQQLAAVQARDPKLSPTKESKEALEMLIALEGAYPKDGKSTIWSKTESATKSWRNGGAKYHDAQTKLQLLSDQDAAEVLIANMDIPNIKFASTGLDAERFIESTANTFAEESSIILTTPNATEQTVTKAQDALRSSATKFLFRRLLATDLNETQLEQVVPYFNNSGSGNDLTAEQKSLIKGMSGYSNRVISKDLTKSLQSDMKGSLAEIRSKLAKDAIKEEQRLVDIRLMGGGGDLTVKSDRVAMDRIEIALGLDPNQFNSMTPDQQGTLLQLYQSTPSNNLLSNLDRMVNGLPVKNGDSILNIYSLMSNGLSETATAGVDYFGSTITDEDKELLNDAFSVVRLGEGESAQEVLGKLIAGKSDPQSKDHLRNVLEATGSSTAFAISVVDDSFVGVELAPLVEYLGLTGKTTGQITNRLKAIVDEKYPVSPNIVDPSRPINNKGRSRFGLMKTIEDEKIRSKFIEIIDSEVIELSAKISAIDKDFPQIRWTPTLGTNERKVYLKPDNTGSSLHYFAHYADRNNELIPFTYYTDDNGNPVKEGTKGSKKQWVSYSIQKEVGADLLKLEEEKNAEMQLKIQQNEKQQQLQFDTSKMSPAEFAAFQQQRMNVQFEGGGIGN